MKSIIKWTLRQRRTSTLWWCFAVASFIFINMIFYPSFKDQAAQLQQSFSNIPDSVLQLIGGSTDFFSPVGYLNGQIFFIMLPLLLGILSISLGSKLIATEEQDKTIESILARPISRSKLLLGKALAGITILGLATVAALVSTTLLAKVVGLDVSTIAIFQATLACFLLCLSFGAVAFALTSSGLSQSSSLGLTTIFAFGGYIIGSLSGTIKWLNTPSKLFSFTYYDSEEILRGTYNWNNIFFFITVVLISCFVAWYFFRSRDLK
ncbi:MAG: beta-exotoxin transport system permease protein [Patescibacteria group bacterium]|nr:beta-exotoxin transport system permease protein [Patescibacteria group bacterium]